jgi:hypothetical protein
VSYDATTRAIEVFTDHVRFERLVVQLLSRNGVDVRPVGGSGDKGRDAVSGPYRAKGGEPLAVTISLNKTWSPKIEKDIKRLTDSGFMPRQVFSVTNRPTNETARSNLQADIKSKYKIDLTIYDRGWLVTQLHRRDNLDLRAEYLNLAPIRPRVFLDLGEYETLLDRRGLLASAFRGREAELDQLEKLLSVDRRAVIFEADGGVGKTRLTYELARSGRSATPWFFLDGDMPFDLDYVGELEAGYEATLLVDDAHRRTDLRQLLAALEARNPVPRLVFTVRPGHAQSVQTALARLALPEPVTVRLGAVGRSELVEVLQAEPFGIQHEGMLRQLLAVSEGNVGIALIAGRLAASGIDPADLEQSTLFADHTEWRLAGAGLDDRANRAALALVSALGSLDLASPEEATAASALLEEGALTRRLDDLADAGLLVEDTPRRFTIKPDIVREHTLRFSFFPDGRRPVLRYEDVYAAFAKRRLRSLFQSLGDARIDLAPGAQNALRLVRDELTQLLDGANTASDLVLVAELVRALGAGGAEIGLAAVDRLLERLARLSGDEFDDVAALLVGALSAAKFGRDQLPHAWARLLRLARLSFDRDAPRSQEAAIAEIGGIYESVPVNYSSADPYILAYIQQTVSEVTTEWWQEENKMPGAVQVAAALVKPAFMLQLERHAQSAANAMSINLYARFLPASTETETVLRLGAHLFTASFPFLEPKQQLEQLTNIEALEHVAGGYSGILATVPTNDLQRLAAVVLSDIEAWLAEHSGEFVLPVAGSVVSRFAMRGRRPRGVRRIRPPRIKTELREYLALIDSRPRGGLSREWEDELAQAQRAGAHYGAQLSEAEDWTSVVDRWSRWIDEFGTLTGLSPNNIALDSVFAEVVGTNRDRARALAEYAIANKRSVSLYFDSLLEALAEDRSNWPLITQWAESESVDAKLAAVRAAARADDALARPILTALAQDGDARVTSLAYWRLVYSPAEGPRGWRLDVAIAAAGRSDDPLEALDRLLSVIRHRTPGRGRLKLKTDQKDAIRAHVIATAASVRLPSHQRLAMSLQELDEYGIDLALSWLRARLDHLREHATTAYMSTLPDELAPFVRAKRRTKEGRAELDALLTEITLPAAKGMYRLALEQAVRWLGEDSAALTAKIGEWIRGDKQKRQLALSFVKTADWKLFTTRAKLVLDARPNDADIRRFLIEVRSYPSSWSGSLEPYYESQSAAYEGWTRSRDHRLRLLGAEAMKKFAQYAAEEKAREHDLRNAL